MVAARCGYGGFALSNGSHNAVLNGSNGLVRAAPNYLIGSIGGFNGCGKRSRFAAGYGQRVLVKRYARAGVDNGEGGTRKHRRDIRYVIFGIRNIAKLKLGAAKHGVCFYRKLQCVQYAAFFYNRNNISIVICSKSHSNVKRAGSGIIYLL